jgi:Tol biopolymer transport system component
MSSFKTTSAARALTRDGRLKMDPTFVNGGEELVFAVQESSTQVSLVRLKLADGSTARLHPQATTSDFEPTFSADGRYYAYVQNRGNLDIRLVVRDTRENRDLPLEGNLSGARRPSLTPDGRRLAFSAPSATGQQIVTVNLQGQDRKNLTQTGFNSWPSFSPDGQHIAFGSSRAGDYDLYVMNADGSDVRRLTNRPGMDLRPAWSPDGRRLAFTSNRDGNYEIYLMSADGSGLYRLTHNAERDDYAAWRPDGRHVVFVGERDGKFDLYLLEVPV